MRDDIYVSGVRYRRVGGGVPFFRGRSFLWLAFMGGLYWTYAQFGTPHLRYEYTYRKGIGHERIYQRCTYLGWEGFQRVAPREGHCSLFLMLKSPEVRS